MSRDQQNALNFIQRLADFKSVPRSLNIAELRQMDRPSRDRAIRLAAQKENQTQKHRRQFGTKLPRGNTPQGQIRSKIDSQARDYEAPTWTKWRSGDETELRYRSMNARRGRIGMYGEERARRDLVERNLRDQYANQTRDADDYGLHAAHVNDSHANQANILLNRRYYEDQENPIRPTPPRVPYKRGE